MGTVQLSRLVYCSVSFSVRHRRRLSSQARFKSHLPVHHFRRAGSVHPFLSFSQSSRRSHCTATSLPKCPHDVVLDLCSYYTCLCTPRGVPHHCEHQQCRRRSVCRCETPCDPRRRGGYHVQRSATVNSTSNILGCTYTTTYTSATFWLVHDAQSTQYAVTRSTGYHVLYT